MEKTIVNVAKATMALGADVATEFPVLLLQNAVVILFLLGAGVTLVVLRGAFLLSLPFIRNHAEIVALFVNIVVSTFEVVVDAFAVVWDGFAGILNVVSTLAGGDLDTPNIPVAFDNPLDGAVSASDVVGAATYVQEHCAEYDNVYTVGGDAVKLYVSEPVCDVARFMYPVEWLHGPFALVSPLYFGGADPNGDNCQADNGHTKTMSTVCCSIGAGYILLEAVLPLFLAVLLLIAIGKPLARMAWNGVVLTGEAAERALVLVFKTLDYLEV